MIQRSMAMASAESVAGRMGSQRLAGADGMFTVLGRLGATTT